MIKNLVSFCLASEFEIIISEIGIVKIPIGVLLVFQVFRAIFINKATQGDTKPRFADWIQSHKCVHLWQKSP